jgi:hypothetical protein
MMTTPSNTITLPQASAGHSRRPVPLPAPSTLDKKARPRLRAAPQAALGLFFLLSAFDAAADFTGSFTVGVNGCADSATEQLCTPVPAVALPTDRVLKVAFDAASTHCSSIIAHILVDGVERFASAPLAPGEGTGLRDFGPVAAGVHQVAVQAEGVAGGCNSGSLAIWSGALSLTVSGLTDADAAVVAPGQSAAVSTMVGGSPAPAAVEAFYTRALDAFGFASLSVATYPPGPVLPGDPALPVGSVAFLDLLLLEATADDLLQAAFFPPHPVLPTGPIHPGDPIHPSDPIRLAYWDGAAWSAVFNTDGTVPLLSSANSFAVNFGATSTPQITELNGTVFAVVAAFGMVGFEPPVDNGALNVANAGRAIPLKFKLYDLGGNPVTDLKAAHLTSVPLSCTASSEGSEVVEEYAAGASGLQNFGDGTYQINWGTAKSFAGSCRRLRLDLGEKNPDGTPFYRTADFRFIR